MEEYIDLKILGRGAKGELTKKVRSKFDQKLYVLKELGQNKLTKNQKAVINILEKNECPYIVRHYFSEANETLFKTDFINDIDLLDYSNTYMELEKPIEENIIWKLLLECCQSIKYLHEQKIIHRNISLENFYMTDDKDIKLGNFKYATIISDNNEDDDDDNYPQGGMLYKNAKALNKSIYNKRSDIYALGIVFHKLCFCQFPYEPVNKGNDKEFELRPFPNNTKKNSDYYSNDLNDLINKMLNEKDDKLQIDDIYNQALNIYQEKYFKNTCIESVLRCLVSFGGYYTLIHNMSEGNKLLPWKDIPTLYNFYKCFDYFLKEKIGEKDSSQYIKYINYFRELIEKNFLLKINEEPKPIDVIDIIFKNYIKEIFMSKDENYNEFLIYLGDEHKKKDNCYYHGILNFDNKKFLFNYLRVNIDKCEKDKNTNEYNILQVIQNSLKSNSNNSILKYQYDSIPRYLIIVLERDEHSTDKIPISIPLEIDCNEGHSKRKHILCAYLNRNIEEGKIIYNSVYYIMRENNNPKWLLSERNFIKELKVNEIKNTYGTPEILFYKLKKK